ncbi:MAG: hypothetical protein R3B06_18505 [Kofleriaceae bacterium]
MGDRWTTGRDRWVALTGLAAAAAALALPTHAHNPELAAVLAVAAVAALAGYRWGIGVVVVAEVFLVAAVWPLAILARPPSTAAQVAVAVSCLGALPGLRLLLAGADDVLDVLGVDSTRWRPLAARGLLVGSGALWLWPALAARA